MGSIFGKQMDENLKKQQQFMLESQRLQLERTLQMQNMMRERMMAMQIAGSRDLFHWVGGTTLLVYIGAAVEFTRNRNRLALIPCFPLTIVSLYLFDMGYWTKPKRLRITAESLLSTQKSLFRLPLGPITIEDIERRRNSEAAEDQLKPNHLFL